MSSAAVATVVKMLESLPDPVQDQIADHLREYIVDLQDELGSDLQGHPNSARYRSSAGEAENCRRTSKASRP